MALQIGRITGLNEPMDWSSNGDLVTMTASYRAASLADGLARRAQLLGYVDNGDEPVIPIQIDGEPRVNGFYRVHGVRVLTDVFVRQQGNLYDFQVDLERVITFKSATIESIVVGALMANTLGVGAATAIGFHGFPNNTYEYVNPGNTGTAVFTRPSADGSTLLNVSVMDPSIYKALIRFNLLPAGFYGGACTIYNLLPANHIVVGAQDAPLHTASTGWIMSNGLVRVQPAATLVGGLYANLLLDWADSTNTFRSAFEIQLSSSLSALAAPSPATTIKIMRNTPEECVIRLPAAGWGIGSGVAMVDVSIRRGSRIVRFYIQSIPVVSGSFGYWQIQSYVAAAATALTGGIIQTAADAYGHKLVFCTSRAAVTNDLVNGRIRTSGAGPNAWDVGASCEIAGSVAL